MFAESNPYHLILARQYSINKAFGAKLGRKKIKYGSHNISQLASKESNWVSVCWRRLQKQVNRLWGLGVTLFQRSGVLGGGRFWPCCSATWSLHGQVRGR